MYEEKAAYRDKVKYSDIWIKLLEQAAIAKAKNEVEEWKHIINSLISFLFKEERDKVRWYKQECIKRNPSFKVDSDTLYLVLQTFIIDTLRSKEYLTSTSKTEIGGLMDVEKPNELEIEEGEEDG